MAQHRIGEPRARRQEVLDVRDAPTLGVFALMFQRVSLSPNLPRLVTLRLTGSAIALPAPTPPRTSYGDYWPIAGWIKAMETRLGAGPLVVGFEREGGTFSISLRDAPPMSGSLEYSEYGPGSPWYRMSGSAAAAEPDARTPLSHYRLAGVHWTSGQDFTRRALVVVRTQGDATFARVVLEGGPVVAGLVAERIDANSLVLGLRGSGAREPVRETFRLRLRADQAASRRP